MTPADLVRRERAALHNLQAAPEGDAVLDAHRRWLDARRGLQAHLGREPGIPLEHRTHRGIVTYSLNATGRLHIATRTQRRA